jgi:hypothetical protein
MPRTQISGCEIRLNEIFSVARMLAARGFTILKALHIKDTLLRRSAPSEEETRVFFESFDSTEKRKSILDSLVASSGDNYQKDQKCFSDTLEWYIGELLVRKFQAFSSSFGVQARNTIRPTLDEMGDFDVLAVLGDMSLFYAECKSGDLKFEEIQKAAERGLVLATAATIVIYEKEQNIRRLLEGRNYPSMDCTCKINEISVTNLDNSNVLMWHDVFFLDARSGLENKLQTCLRLVAQRKNGYLQIFGADVDYLAGRGFKIN